MNELVKIKGDDVFTDSLIIADGTNNKHINVKELIKDYKSHFIQLGNLSVLNREINREETRGRKEEIIELNEPQASFLMTLLRNSETVVNFKLELVKEFYRMKQFILERRTAEWQQARLTGKKTRRDETDVILTKLIPLAESQGSKNAGKLYITYSKLVNSMLGIEAGQRDKLPLDYIEAIKFLERAIENIISIEVDRGTHYKEIYQTCKVKCQIVKELAFLPTLKITG